MNIIHLSPKTPNQRLRSASMATRSNTKSRIPPTDQENPPSPPSPRKPKPSPPRRRRRLLLPLLLFTSLLVLVLTTSSLLRHANLLGRRCTPLPPKTVLSQQHLKMVIVSLSAERKHEAGTDMQRRRFGGLMEVVGENKKQYAAAMGYEFVDAGDVLDPTRPPNWSKILAVKSLLRRYQWVFWNDADTVVTNRKIRLEDVLLSAIGHADFDASPDLVVTEDYNGVNSGVFFVRQSAWSERFLDTWWNQTSLINFGSTKSGDNAAMKQLIDGLQPEEYRKHVRVAPMQCMFNSYLWFPTWKSVLRLITSPVTTWQGAFSEGDFMVHLAGLDDKTKWATEIIQEMKVTG